MEAMFIRRYNGEMKELEEKAYDACVSPLLRKLNVSEQKFVNYMKWAKEVRKVDAHPWKEQELNALTADQMAISSAQYSALIAEAFRFVTRSDTPFAESRKLVFTMKE